MSWNDILKKNIPAIVGVFLVISFLVFAILIYPGEAPVECARVETEEGR